MHAKYTIFAVRPLLVEITFNNQPMSADRKYEIECQAIGSRPPAKITWWMGNLEMHGHSQKVGVSNSLMCMLFFLTITIFAGLRGWQR